MLSKRRSSSVGGGGGGGGRHGRRNKITALSSDTKQLKLPLMRIKMPDYENYHNDKERLMKTASQWMAEPLELDAAMDLESLRKILAKDYPMDTCCFLDCKE